MNKLQTGQLALTVLLLAGCAVGPKYHAPSPAPVAALSIDPHQYAAAAPEAAWWGAFHDPVLAELEHRALAGNLDLRVALDRVREARALFADAELDRYPHVTNVANYTRSDEQYPGFGNAPLNVQSAELGFDATWEIDLFGYVQHETEAARAEAEAAEADRRDTEVTVAAEVARSYFELRGAQDRLTIARANAQSEEQTAQLTALRYQVGRGDPVDVQSSQARESATEATIPELITDETVAGDRLAVLTGARPGTIDALLAPPAVPPAPLVTPLPIGDASGFLRRRPDVQAAERRLAEQTARVGVATAALFPRVNVTGFIGLLTGNVSGLFANASKAWAVSPTVTWPGLDLGSAEAKLRAQKAQADESLADYNQTVLGAIEDLQNSLVTYSQTQTEITSLARQVDASTRAADLARIRYKEGAIDFLVLLDAERTQLQAEDALAVAQTDANTGVVGVYKALGGGWS